MTQQEKRDLEEYRKNEAGPIENAVLDDYLHGEIDRREFIKRASWVGISAGALARFGLVPRVHVPRPVAPRASAGIGPRIRVGIIPAPSAALEPSLLNQVGQIEMCSIGGEYLARATHTSALMPELATSWKPNASGTVWTYKIRRGVKFQSGQPLSAKDVVATWKVLAGPNSAAQSAIGAYLKPSGVQEVNDYTVAFHLESPISNFPWLAASTLYSSIILPWNYKAGTYVSKPGKVTGGFELVSYTEGVGAKFNRFNGWWGGRTPLSGVDVTFYETTASADAALIGGNIDLLGQASYESDKPLFFDPSLTIFTAPGPNFRSIPIRCDEKGKPWYDYRVRQAMALTINRSHTAKLLWGNNAIVGNDSPFHPIYGLIPAGAVKQRGEDLKTAKQLMEAAGHAKGFSVTLTTQQYQEIPEYVQIFQSAVKNINIHMKLNIESVDTYFGGSYTPPPWGNTPWLNGDITCTNWGARPVPDTLLTAALQTDGVWNASHYSNKTFDGLIKSYLSNPNFSDQQKYAVQMQNILLHDTPEIISYFYDYTSVGTKHVQNFKADEISLIYLSKTSLT